MAASHFFTGTHHCAILDSKEHGANHRLFNECTLHPGHKKFMTVDQFLNKKPSEVGLESDWEMSNVRNLIDHTVRVVVHHTSVDRPDTFINSEKPYPFKDIEGSSFIRYGTGCLSEHCNVGNDNNSDDDDDHDDDDDNNNNGNDGDNDNDTGDNDNGYDDNFEYRNVDNNDCNYVDGDVDNGNDDSDVKERCPCRECTTSKCQTPNRKSYYFIIRTATHVVFDELEAQSAVFEFFYDSEDRSNVGKVYGITVLDTRHIRLQTDCCRVVCVTHVDSLAEKLRELCKDYDDFWVNKVFVSHPHGVSKRISLGDFPSRTIVVIPNKQSVQLKKGTEIRFSECRDDVHVVQDINRLLDKRLPVVFDDVSNNLVLDCDLNVYRPEGVVVETEHRDYFDKKGYKRIPKNKVWCNIFYPGTQLVTEDGRRYTFPYKMPRVKMEVFVKTEYFFDKNDNHSVFMYRRYNMAACPGSSGAPVGSFGYYLLYGPLGHVHFGNSGDFNTSTLYRIHTPDGEQESATKHMIGTKLDEDSSRYKKRFYDQITGI